MQHTIQQTMQLSIYPPPRRLKISKQRLSITNRHFLRLCSTHSIQLNDAIRRFTDRCPKQLQITHGNVPSTETLLTLRLSRSKMGLEAYQINNSEEGLVLTADTETGLFRGLSTLQQIFATPRSDLPYFQLDDQPDFKNRGLMLDVSRCKVPSLRTLKQMIDSFAELKYNQLQLYTEHTFAFSSHPLVWSNASPFTAADMMEIHAYCRARYIELVPSLNCFGHFERWLRYPEYHQYAECPEGFTHPITKSKIPFGSTLKPNRQSLRLIDQLYEEYLPLFDSDQVNVGGDEPWELGKGWSAARCQKQGTANVYIDFMKNIKGLAKKHGKQMMFWSDIVLKEPESLKRLSKDLIAMNWGYEGNHPFKKECAQLAAQKIPYYVCPGTSTWNALTGRTSNARKNLSSAAKNGLDFGAIGYLVTDWGDHGHHQYLPFSYPGFALGACESWNHKGSRGIDMIDLLNQTYFKETDKTAATLLSRMGSLLELAQTPLANASIFNKLLFSPMTSLEKSFVNKQSLSTSRLRQCEAEIADIKSQLPLIVGLERDLLSAEFENALDMAKHGIDRLRYARGEAIEAKILRRDMAKIAGRHESLWLSRNRPGGLAESSGYLTRRGEEYG